MLGAIDTLDAPVAARSAEPNVTVGADGRVWLSWLEGAADSATALRVAAFNGTSWSAPATVVSRRDLFVNWADFPSLHVAENGTLVAHWLQRSGSGKYAYDVHVSRSKDDGATWSEPLILHRDRNPAEHGFVSLFAGAGSTVTAVWLDGRKYPDTAAPDEMQLISTTIDANGSLGTETVVDTRICDCCQTDAAQTSRGPLIVYRDRSDAEIRDIYAVRRDSASWTTPTAVHADNWKIPGCPVNGPAVAARGDVAAVAWFTAAEDTARVRLAYSFDAGNTFNPPLRIDGGMPVGRVDVQLGDSGQAIVAWLERTDSASAEVRLRVAEPNGALSPPVVLASTAASRASGFPRMALQRVNGESSLIVAWTVPGDSSRVRVARVRLRSTERESP
ncbi:MAG: sialidase family protein [Gemmatimonadota bacterium]